MLTRPSLSGSPDHDRIGLRNVCQRLPSQILNFFVQVFCRFSHLVAFTHLTCLRLYIIHLGQPNSRDSSLLSLPRLVSSPVAAILIRLSRNSLAILVQQSDLLHFPLIAFFHFLVSCFHSLLLNFSLLLISSFHN